MLLIDSKTLVNPPPPLNIHTHIQTHTENLAVTPMNIINMQACPSYSVLSSIIKYSIKRQSMAPYFIYALLDGKKKKIRRTGGILHFLVSFSQNGGKK